MSMCPAAVLRASRLGAMCLPARWTLPLIGGVLLLAQYTWADAPDKYEPDNSPFFATELDLTGVAQTHTLSPNGDYDIYKFTLDADADVYFDFEPLTGDPKPLLGFGLFSSSISLLRNLDDALAAASYLRLTEDTNEFGPVVRVAHLTKGTYFGVAVFVTCFSNTDCNSMPTYRIAATKLGGPDRYEPDDSHLTARWLEVNGPAQIHQFVSPTDQDWVGFSSPGPGCSLTITAVQAGSLAVPFLQLYQADGVTLIAQSAKSAGAKAETVVQLDYVTQPTDTDFLYVRVTNLAKDGGADESFSLGAKSTGSPLPSALAGVVTQRVSGGGGCGTPAPAIANATITIENLGGVSTLSDDTGVYAFSSIPSDTYTVTASATGFVSASRTLAVNGTTTLDFSLTPVKSAETFASLLGSNAAGDAAVLALTMAVIWYRGRRSRHVKP